MARPRADAWILLVDPECARRRDRAEALERCGHRVLPASDTEVADAVLRTRRVDVLVVHQDASPTPEALGGVSPPRGPGSRAGSSRSRSSPSPVPTIVLVAPDPGPASVSAPTGFADGGPRAEVQQRRLVARLAEPVDPAALEQVVRNMVARPCPVRAVRVASMIVPAAIRPTRPDVFGKFRTSG